MSQSRRADAAQAFDDAFFALILQFKLNGFGDLTFHAEVYDIALLLKDTGDALLHPGVGDIDRREQGAISVANTGQHVGNGIVHNKFSGGLRVLD
jgi:hypothetical protein